MQMSTFFKTFLFLFIIYTSETSASSHWDDEKCPRLVTRSQWGAKRAGKIEYMSTIPVKNVILQHTATPACTTMNECVQRVASIQSYHMQDLKWGDIGLSFLIGGDGAVYEGRGWHLVGAHTRGYNRNSIGVALIGNFENSLPPKAQLSALRKFLTCGVELERLSEDFKLIAQRQVTPTVSPGLSLFLEIQTWPEWTEV